MSKMKRYAAIFLIILLIPFAASTASAATGTNQQGRSAAELGETLFMIITNSDRESTLNRLPSAGGDLTRVDTQTQISDLISLNDRVYYLRYDPPAYQIVSTDAQGQALDILTEFEGKVVEKLSHYDGLFYCLVDNILTLIDPSTGDTDPLTPDIEMTDYAIINDIIYYISKTNTQSYEMLANGATVTGTAGLLYSMTITGNNSEQILDQGVTDLQPHGNYIYLHNMADSYPTESAQGLVWLEGKLYRLDVANNQLHSMNLPYDWMSIPTDHGVVVYTSQNISLYPAEGGLARQLMTPEAYTTLSATDTSAYVYEHKKGQLTAIPLAEDGEPKVLYSGGPITELLPNDAKSIDETSNTSLTEEVILEDDVVNPDDPSATEGGENYDTPATSDSTSTGTSSGTSTGTSANTDDGYYDYDDTSDSSSSGSSDSSDSSDDYIEEDDDYIFALSSERRLSRNKVLSVSKSKWGYARNEIFARHGYVFGDGKYGKYFRSKDWYMPGGYSDSKLNNIEWDNVELIRKMEVEFGLIKDTQKKVVPASPKATPKPTKKPSSSSGSSSSGSSSSSGRVKLSKNVFPSSSTKKLTASQLSGLSSSKLAIARNEILARHGFPFQQSKWQKYFKGTGWKSRSGFSYSELNSTESYNIELIKKYE